MKIKFVFVFMFVLLMSVSSWADADSVFHVSQKNAPECPARMNDAYRSYFFDDLINIIQSGKTSTEVEALRRLDLIDAVVNREKTSFEICSNGNLKVIWSGKIKRVGMPLTLSFNVPITYTVGYPVSGSFVVAK